MSPDELWQRCTADQRDKIASEFLTLDDCQQVVDVLAGADEDNLGLVETALLWETASNPWFLYRNERLQFMAKLGQIGSEITQH